MFKESIETDEIAKASFFKKIGPASHLVPNITTDANPI